MRRIKHLTVRFAWHDAEWNGKVCENPEENIYCEDNYSLLSSRIQRRKDVDIEKEYRGESLSKIVNETGYVPPCYWCINTMGAEEHDIKNVHPYCDFKEEWEKVSPIEESLKPWSIYTWDFGLSYLDVPQSRKYPTPSDLRDRVRKYIEEIEPNKSLVFLYANYSNPITREEKKYLLLGVGLVRDEIEFPEKYEIPSKLLEEERKDKPNFPEIAWQLQVPLDPQSTFILPYQRYLDEIEKREGTEKEELKEALDQIAMKVEDPTIEPHFKYVSKHVNHDKAIYLLYKIKNSIDKLKDHGIARPNEINDAEKKINKLLELAWENRDEYPGLENLLKVYLKHDFDGEVLEEVIGKFKNIIRNNFESISEFLSDPNNIEELPVTKGRINRVIDITKDKFSELEYLSRFDFSQRQFKNVLDFISEKGFQNFKQNPYQLLEKYPTDLEDDHWNIEENDYGISIYQLDIPLIPDPKYVNRKALFRAKSLERIRALISKILKDIVEEEGNTYLTRDEVIEKIQDYPLYYIHEDLDLDLSSMEKFESEPKFKEHFIIGDKGEPTLYQLKSIRNIEKTIENFVENLKGDKQDYDSNKVSRLANEDLDWFKEKISKNKETCDIFKEERENLYRKILGNKLSVLSGKAGSGKTTVIQKIVGEFSKQEKKPIYVLTPTGKASLVIRDRLRNEGVHEEDYVKVSTIHRFIYRVLFDFGHVSRDLRGKIFDVINLASNIVEEGDYGLIGEFKRKARDLRLRPKVLIIDEASMVDEVLLSLLFSLVDPNALEHVLLVGDERQLPPIGIGKPFVDTLYHLKQQGLENNYHQLEFNLRFPSEEGDVAKLEHLAELFRLQEDFSPTEIEKILSSSDETFDLEYFGNTEDLKDKLRSILQDISEFQGEEEDLKKTFTSIFQPHEGENVYENLEKVQIITPKRVGKFGTMGINNRVVLESNVDDRFSPGTKIICEENQYWEINGDRILSLANGSLGYIRKDNGNVKFADLEELIELHNNPGPVYGKMGKLKKKLLSHSLSTETGFSPAYAITIHKSQGSDFNHTILVISEESTFITRELLYTGFTRAEKGMKVLVHEDLSDDLSELLVRAHNRSQIENTKTLLFGHKDSPLKPYVVRKSDGGKISVRSKIEYMIAKAMDDIGIDFEYEPGDFERHYMKPDFKIYLDQEEVYWEHLGLLDKDWYKKRWFEKLEKYEELGIKNRLVTTNEEKEKRDIESSVRKIIDDLEKNDLRRTEGSYSKHHYPI